MHCFLHRNLPICSAHLLYLSENRYIIIISCFQAIEISYATPGLTLLMLVPKEPTLRKLVEKVTGAGLERVLAVMHQLRAAVTLPLYTLRMTLLLPNKLEDVS